MGRGGALRRAQAAPTPALVLTLLIAAAAVGCGGSGDGAGGSGAAHSTSAPPRAVSGEQLCVSAVGYWARETLDGRESYGDYQSMGLSDRQYGVLREVLDAARATERDRGARAAGTSIDRQVRQACAEGYRDGGPSDGPWR
ncbi:hypothetical protein [Streptomyces sp. NPDC048392]|uniref:hypothetical protein n=1 Tax=Streptomyces sp. NPDC048392 TaxID=3365543 RepID=UPI00371CA543